MPTQRKVPEHKPVDSYEFEVEDLLGRTLTKIENHTDDGDDVLDFTTDDGVVYRMYHAQDCCECVSLNEVVGDLDDLLETPILSVAEVSHSGDRNSCVSETWTFYTIATIKGYVTLRWYGTSNGYYSESVSFKRIL